MRFQGKIIEWRDEQGFGFISQNGDHKRVFVHINNFAKRGRRPVLNDVVTYRLGTENGRECAQDVAYASMIGSVSHKPLGKDRGDSLWGWLASLYVSVAVVSVVIGSLPWNFLGYLAAINLLSYFAYAIDKKAAQKAAWRTPEARLHLFDLMGGWPAGLFAQKRLRHKSGKSSFQTMYKITVLLHLMGVVWLFSSYGSAARALLMSGA